MINFIVPVKSKKVASDWPRFCALFERTLSSICNQTNDNYMVTVVCHEIPEVKFKSDKVHFVQVEFDAPKLTSGDVEKNRALREGDKANKIKKGLEYSTQFDPKYIMVVDSDDCISNKIAAFIHTEDGSVPGWYVDKGYNYKEGSKYILLKKRTFNHLCGSCIIIKPELFEQLFATEPFLHYSHEKTVLSNNSKLVPLPFAGAIYSMANGENIFMSSGHAKGVIKRYVFNVGKYFQLLEKVYKYRVRIINKKFERSFGFYKIQSI
ncbi:MAG: hypothetical protein AAFZ89_04295 [Bacteroidota bacterium]